MRMAYSQPKWLKMHNFWQKCMDFSPPKGPTMHTNKNAWTIVDQTEQKCAIFDQNTLTNAFQNGQNAWLSKEMNGLAIVHQNEQKCAIFDTNI